MFSAAARQCQRGHGRTDSVSHGVGVRACVRSHGPEAGCGRSRASASNDEEEKAREKFTDDVIKQAPGRPPRLAAQMDAGDGAWGPPAAAGAAGSLVGEIRTLGKADDGAAKALLRRIVGHVRRNRGELPA